MILNNQSLFGANMIRTIFLIIISCLYISSCRPKDVNNESSAKLIRDSGTPSRLIGGSKAIDGLFPATVGIGKCGAARVAQFKFLIAAHCLMDGPGMEFLL